jgi:hypothetical protein
MFRIVNQSVRVKVRYLGDPLVYRRIARAD